jgi:hypothetical protein
MSELELSDAILRHALELQRLSAHDEAEALEIMRQLEGELRQLLASGNLSEAGRREIAELIAAADKAVTSRYAQLAGTVDVHELVVVVADKTVAAMATIAPRIAAPSAARLASLAKDILIDGSPARAWWARQGEDLTFKFAAEVRQGVLLEETQEQIVTRIVGRRGEPGIMDAARRNVRSLVHSSVMTAANQSRLATFKANGRHGQGIRRLATLDSNTCLQCAALDGAEWDFDLKPIRGTSIQYVPAPSHFSCRCVDTVIPKSLDDILGVEGLDAQLESTRTRASKDGPTKATTMAAFLKRQSPEFVEEMLGAKRAEMFLSGKLTLRDLVSGTGRPLSLAELKAR